MQLLNDGVLKANATKMLVNDGEMFANDGEMLVNDDEMSIWSYTHFTIIDEHFITINEHFSSIDLKYTIIHSSDHHWEAAPNALREREYREKTADRYKIKQLFYFIIFYILGWKASRRQQIRKNKGFLCFNIT